MQHRCQNSALEKKTKTKDKAIITHHASPLLRSGSADFFRGLWFLQRSWQIPRTCPASRCPFAPWRHLEDGKATKNTDEDSNETLLTNRRPKAKHKKIKTEKEHHLKKTLNKKIQQNTNKKPTKVNKTQKI